MKMNLRDDFIGVFDDIFTPARCEAFIDFFKKAQQAGLVVDRQSSENVSPFTKDDLAVTATGLSITPWMLEKEPDLAQVYVHSNEFAKKLTNEALKEYCRKYPGLAGFPDGEQRVHIQDVKLQRTLPGQGYHVWHHEHGVGGRAHRRLLAFSLYCNTVEEGGETEFLYQKVRFKPVMGQLLIWPAYFTHAHRGNPPLSGEKYIVTGWIEK